jgi:hypothetical protein
MTSHIEFLDQSTNSLGADIRPQTDKYTDGRTDGQTDVEIWLPHKVIIIIAL